MYTKVLERESTVNEVPEVTSVGIRAWHELGYRPLSNQDTRNKADIQLLNELIAMGHAPFTDKSVSTYRRKTQVRTNLRNYFASSVAKTTYSLICIMLIGAYLKSDAIFITFLMLSVFGVVLSVTIPDFVSWKSNELKKYSLPIPKDVLTKALAVKKDIVKFGELDFRVVSLQAYAASIYDDPFLTVSTAYSRQFYIAVWDEPTFEDSQKE